MPLVNNITTRDEFKRRLGRTGLSSAFKKKDTVSMKYCSTCTTPRYGETGRRNKR